jgi:hypothetical protein
MPRKLKPDVPDMLQHFIEAKDRDGTSHSFLGVLGEASIVRKSSLLPD